MSCTYIYIRDTSELSVSDLCLRPHPFGPRETAMGEDSWCTGSLSLTEGRHMLNMSDQ